MKRALILFFAAFLFSLITMSAFSEMTLTGAGATFPYPLYTKWAEVYQKQTGVKLNYQAIGSGGGIKQIQAGTVDFGASDKPLSPEELAQDKLLQFPTVVGGIVPIVNLPDVVNSQIKLSGKILADIYLGKITKWNDPQIAGLNTGVTLPNQHITVVHRSDGSGTSFLFTNYLSKVNDAWKTQVGSDTAVAWPTGIGGKGNEGVASYVQRIKGSIGYVEFAYAQQNHLKIMQLINKAGSAVSPSITSFQAAADNTHWNKANNFSEILTDQAGTNSWPITGATFVLIHQSPTNSAKTQAVLQFFTWAFKDGKQMATELDYVPLPDSLTKLIDSYWHENT